ncbi:efflux RND transporter periplasmic adaptor subunit [Niabella beijingensis]|uniref:efflux RND transporter periplasmic adaptor subunit n=1 Tax=Niabella beijingensis TaxID=2872700 RepID=UPI001CBD50AC|nr:efflux RND transporter periplasmic adaptor subunit [Niabella beijingensis]MBZ4191862.1 efflux RND transporter periplasmic adaptor subunit [Niabella beijingensis]
MNRIALLISLCMITYGTTSCKSNKEEKTEPESFSVTSPLKMDTTYVKEYVSQLQSLRNVEVRAQEKGYLEKSYVDEGQYVKAGQLLFRIMPRIYQAEYQKAKAEAHSAELEMQNTHLLADKEIVSQNELALSKAKYDVAKAEMALAGTHLSFTDIRAPFSGVIDRIRFKQGSLIDEGTLLTTLSDNSGIYAYFNVSESEYLNFKTDTTGTTKTPLALTLANAERYKYPGMIETIEGEFDNTTGNIAFRAKFPNPEGLLKHGETGKVLMQIPLKNALVIPQKATYELQDKIYVYVVDKNNKVRSRNITVKYELPNLYVVDSGLSENDHILLEGLQTIKEDQKIKPAYTAPDQVVSKLQLLNQ